MTNFSPIDFQNASEKHEDRDPFMCKTWRIGVAKWQSVWCWNSNDVQPMFEIDFDIGGSSSESGSE